LVYYHFFRNGGYYEIRREITLRFAIIICLEIEPANYQVVSNWKEYFLGGVELNSDIKINKFTRK